MNLLNPNLFIKMMVITAGKTTDFFGIVMDVLPEI